MKRTERLDREQEIALPMLGQDVFTTKGDLLNTPAEDEEKRAKLRAGKRRAVVQTLAEGAMDEINAWAKEATMRFIPDSALRKNEGGDWLAQNGCYFLRDGLTWLLMKGPTELGRYTLHNIPVQDQPDVIRHLDEVEKAMGI